MPYADAIHYTTGDLLATPRPDGQFAAVTAISVIEHGVPDEGLCREVSRLLRPGGVFIFTTDYWPQKIVTTERMFDLDWRIFDTAEIEALVTSRKLTTYIQRWTRALRFGTSGLQRFIRRQGLHVSLRDVHSRQGLAPEASPGRGEMGDDIGHRRDDLVPAERQFACSSAHTRCQAVVAGEPLERSGEPSTSPGSTRGGLAVSQPRRVLRAAGRDHRGTVDDCRQRLV